MKLWISPQQADFWKELSSIEPSLSRLDALGCDFDLHSHSTDDAYKQMLRLMPQGVTVMRQYAQFLAEVSAACFERDVCLREMCFSRADMLCRTCVAGIQQFIKGPQSPCRGWHHWRTRASVAYNQNRINRAAVQSGKSCFCIVTVGFAQLT